MAMNKEYSDDAPSRAEVDTMKEPLVIEFGTGWCGYCLAAQPLIESAFVGYSGVRHLKVEDGPGRALGRSFRVKLWPTLIFMKQGEEVKRVVRPESTEAIREGLALIDDRA